MRFKIGQEVACIKSFKLSYAPKEGEEFVVECEDWNHPGFLVLEGDFDREGITHTWCQSKFAPLDDWQQADELVEQLTIDTKQPNTVEI